MKSSSTRVRSEFSSVRVVAVWNGLLEDSIDFGSLGRFKNSIIVNDFTAHLI